MKKIAARVFTETGRDTANTMLGEISWGALCTIVVLMLSLAFAFCIISVFLCYMCFTIENPLKRVFQKQKPSSCQHQQEPQQQVEKKQIEKTDHVEEIEQKKDEKQDEKKGKHNEKSGESCQKQQNQSKKEQPKE